MHEIFQKMEFREFSYELDPESIVDMHRSAEVLEGSWFDNENSCKIHTKAVVRTPGSTWCLVYKTMVFAHADLTKLDKQQAVVPYFRIHPDYKHPTVVKKLIDGLKKAAFQRQYSSLLIFGDIEEVKEEMAMNAIPFDRKYKYIEVSESNDSVVLPFTRILIRPDETHRSDLVPFMGTPLAPAYILNRAYTACDYGLFHYTKPNLFEIEFNMKTYVACHDGREWHVFKKGNFKGEPEAVKPLISTIAEIKKGRLLLSEKLFEISESTPVDEGEYYDFYLEV